MKMLVIKLDFNWIYTILLINLNKILSSLFIYKNVILKILITMKIMQKLRQDCKACNPICAILNHKNCVIINKLDKNILWFFFAQIICIIKLVK